MTNEEVKAIVKEVVKEELKDLVKTINRIYEDREILLDLKVRVGTLEDISKSHVGELKKAKKDLAEDIADVQVGISEVQETMKEGN